MRLLDGRIACDVCRTVKGIALNRFFRYLIMLAALLTGLITLTTTLAGRFSAGAQLSYVTQKDSNNWDIALIDTRHRLSIDLTERLLPGNARNRLPTWSPDGRTVAFVSDYGGETHIYLYKPETQSFRQLTQTDNVYSSLSWTPDGERLVVSATLSTPIGVSEIDVTTGRITYLTDASEPDTHALIDPTGQSIAYVRYDVRSPRLIRYNRADQTSQCAAHCSDSIRQIGVLSWSPDGTRLAYVYNPFEHKRVLYVVDLASGAASGLVEGASLISDVAWSPDGTQLVISTEDEMHIIPSTGAVAQPMGSVLAPLRLGGFIGEMDWSADGKHIALVMSSQTMPQEIMLFDVATGGLRRLTASEQLDWAPTWRPAS